MKAVGFHILLSLCITVQLFATNDSTTSASIGILLEKAQTIKTQDPDSAIQLFRRCYNEYIEIADTSGAIQSLKRWSGVNGHLANYRESYDKLWKALILANEADMEAEKASLYIMIGRYYSFYKRKKETFHYLGLSLEINKRLVANGSLPAASLVDNYYAYCATYREINEPELAQAYLDSCFSLYSPENSSSTIYQLKFEQAFILKESQQYSKALTLFQEIKPWFEQHRPTYQVLLLTYLGDTYKALKNYPESLTSYQTALDISETYNSHLDFSPLVHEKLADLYVQIGEYALAYQSLSRAKELDAIFFDSRSENNRPLLEIQDEFREEQEKREKLLQEQRIAQLEHEDQVQFLQRTILIVSLILLLTIGFVYFNYTRSKLRAEKLEHEKDQEINQIKLRFFTNISHEFKTPLTLILGPLQQLLSMDHLEESLRGPLNMMERNANQLKRLINQIIEFRKVESREVKLNAAFGDLVYFCRELTDSFEVLAKDKQISISFESSQVEIGVWFDRDKVEKIVNNLLSNAIKYTPEGGHIRLSMEEVKKDFATQTPKPLRSGYVELVVEDTGQGIPHDQLERVFERYYQIDTGKYAVQIGSGIGLALTKELVALHQGDISLQSQEGEGSRFIIRLPLGSQHLTTDQKHTDADFFEEGEEILRPPIPSLTPSATPVPPDNSLLTDQQELPVLLIIEDHHDMQAFIRKMFEKDYRILQAANGQTGLNVALSEVPDLIISDVMMPGMDGITVCQQLKSHTVTNHIPIVLLTARSSIEHRIQGLQTGADAYIPKPFHTEHLRVRVHQLLEQREKLRAKYETGQIKLDSQKFGIEEAEKRFLKRAEELIEHNITNPEFTATQFHQDLGFSRMQLYRKLKSLTGLSANEFIRTYKVKKAAVYLKDSNLNITEILYEVGFTNRSYFSKCFKQMYGMSPREYIKEHKAHHV